MHWDWFECCLEGIGLQDNLSLRDKIELSELGRMVGQHENREQVRILGHCRSGHFVGQVATL